MSFLLILLTVLSGCASTEDRVPVPRELKGKPLPQLKISSEDYDRAKIDQKFRDLPVHRQFARSYQCAEGKKVTAPLVDYLIGLAQSKKSDFKELRQCLKVVMPEKTRSVAIPCYVEKAKFDGTDAWIIVQNWGMPGEKMSHIRVWVIDPEQWQILYASSNK